MGKASRAKQAPKQPKIHHFTLDTEAYIALRRYLGSKPHDETRQLVELLERMPAITEEDVLLRVRHAMELADFKADPLYSIEHPSANGADQGKIIDNPEDFPNEEIEELGLMTTPDPDTDVATDTEGEQ